MRWDWRTCGCGQRTAAVAIGCYYVANGVATAALCFTIPSTLYETVNESVAISAGMRGIFLGVGVMMLVQVFASASLIFGACKGKAVFMLPWMAYACVFVALAVIVATIFIVRIIYTEDWLAIFMIVIEVFHVALTLYLLTVVDNYRKSLQQRPSCEASPSSAQSSTKTT